MKRADTAASAIECLAQDSTYPTAGATAIPDPEARGVWLVTLADKSKVLVYLKGHGQQEHAPFDDFEEVY